MRLLLEHIVKSVAAAQKVKAPDLCCGMQALPQWAQQTLARHAGDARECQSMEQLEEGTTGDHIWDAMQHQLKSTGVPTPCHRFPSLAVVHELVLSVLRYTTARLCALSSTILSATEIVLAPPCQRQ